MLFFFCKFNLTLMNILKIKLGLCKELSRKRFFLHFFHSMLLFSFSKMHKIELGVYISKDFQL